MNASEVRANALRMVKGNSGVRAPTKMGRGAVVDFALVGGLLFGIIAILEAFGEPIRREVDLSNPEIQHPHLPDIVSGKMVVFIAFSVPALAFLSVEAASIRRGSHQSPTRAVSFFLGLAETNGCTVAITNVLKLVVGRPRPYFATACVAFVEGSKTLCSGDAHGVREARKSFPSGHSSLSFSAAIYVAFFIATKLRLSHSSSTPKTWKILVVLAAPFGASLIAASRTVDYHHHYSDIVAGSLLGASIAMVVWATRKGELQESGVVDVENSELTVMSSGYEALAIV